MDSGTDLIVSQPETTVSGLESIDSGPETTVTSARKTLSEFPFPGTSSMRIHDREEPASCQS